MPSGIAHLDEKMAFGETTESFGSREEVRAFLDLHGGICDAQTDQETTIFALSIRRNAINEGVKLLLETAFRPVIDEKNVAEAIQNVDNDIRYLKYEKIRDKEIMELACQAGYRGNTIGLPRMVPEELLEKCSDPAEVKNWVENLLKYRKDNYSKSPSFIGIGVTQEELTNAVKKNGHIYESPSWSDYDSQSTSDISLSQWTGGFAHRAEEAVNTFSVFGGDTKEAYFCIAFEAPAYRDTTEKYHAHVLRALLGGGSAFESGGPGKGLYCLFYADVLASIDGQRFSHFKSFYKEFQDSGIFGIYGMGPPDSIRPGIRIAIEQLRRIANGQFSKEQLERAKTQLSRQFLRDMEVRAMMMEAFARETVAYGEPTNPNVNCEKINAVEHRDLVKLAKQLLNTVPSVSILGESTETDKLFQDVCMHQFNGKALDNVMMTRLKSFAANIKG